MYFSRKCSNTRYFTLCSGDLSGETVSNALLKSNICLDSGVEGTERLCMVVISLTISSAKLVRSYGRHFKNGAVSRSIL